MAADNRETLSDGLAQDFNAARLQIAKLHGGAEVTLREVWLQLAEVVATALQVERVGVWVLADEDRVLRCRYLLQRSNHDVYEGAILRCQDFPEYFRALHARRTVAADDAPASVLTSELSEPYLEPLGIASMLDAPIYIHGKVVGVVCHEHIGEPRSWSEGEKDFASTVADNIARIYEEHEYRHAQSALRSYERHLMELHRMEAVGRLAAEIAHDFRGILNAAQGFAELIRRVPHVPPEVDRYAQRIIDAMQRGGHLTQEVTSFGKDSPVAPRVVDVRDVIASMLGMFRMLLGDRIDLQLEQESAVSRVFIDVSQLERALLNLVLNARDAMPNGGTLHIGAVDALVDDDEGGHPKFVCLYVTDNGIGMDAATCSNVLKPFFTTKGEAGTGLGLAIVEQIVTRAGGFIRIESEPGKGTTVRLHLPRIAGAVRS